MDGCEERSDLVCPLQVLSDKGVNLQAIELIRHNMVVFSNGEHALQTLPPLVDSMPEAKLNLVIYYLRHNSVHEAHELVKDLEPSTPQEYILKGVVHASIGQATGSREHMKVTYEYQCPVACHSQLCSC